MPSSYPTNNETAFTAKFRIIQNKRQDSDRSPQEKICMDFTATTAVKMAEWLIASAEQAETEGTTIRVYSSKDNYTEEVGFSMWGGIWGTSGKFSPLKPESLPTKSVSSRGKENIPF
tara:strand:- start:2047 stop:2397 length:351 start_codon:yes stop_codon:yes gene_type:complete